MWTVTEPLFNPPEAPLLTLTELIPLLSVATTVKVTIWLWLPVVSETVVSSAVNEEIDGIEVSVFVTVIALLAVAELPAASVTVAVSLILVVP